MTGGAGKDLIGHLGRSGIRARLVSLEDAESAREQVRTLHRDGAVDDGIYQEWIRKYMDHSLPKNVRRARSVLIYSWPSPPLHVGFGWKGRTVDLVIPPSYHDYWKSVSVVRGRVKQATGRSDCYVAKAVVPLKLLGVRSGLARYGRNNVTYVEGNGSFQRLGAMYTDLEPDGEEPGGMTPLPKCRTCRACVKACPTGAVCADRFLVKAERCITRYNERTAKHPFPGWISPSWHNALVGCMKCQVACPYNRDVLGLRKEGGSFTETDTAYLLGGKFSGQKATLMGRRLRRIGLELTVFPRNLEVLLGPTRPKRQAGH